MSNLPFHCAKIGVANSGRGKYGCGAGCADADWLIAGGGGIPDVVNGVLKARLRCE